MDENEVMQNDQNVSTNDTNSISANSEDISEYSIVLEEQTQYPYSAVNRTSFDRSVSSYDINSELFVINVYLGSELEPSYVFPVPNEYIDDIQVKNNMVYNLGDSTIRLASYYDVGTMYYEVLEIPVYGSEEYFNCLSESSAYSSLNSNPQPYNVYVGVVDDNKQLSLIDHVFEDPRFEISGSSMIGWSLNTIFLFLIFIVLLVKTIFRKG